MDDRDPPKLNRDGRPIWFVTDDPSEGGSRPATRQGCLAFLSAGVWIWICGTVFPIIMVVTLDPRWMIAGFVVCAVGLVVFARLVRRHS